jgi:hydrogenase-4 component F
MIEVLVLIPVFTAVACYFLNRRHWIELASTLGAGILLVVSTMLSYEVFTRGPIQEGVFYLDQLSAYMLMLLAFVAFMVALYSIGYMGTEFEEKRFGIGRLRAFYTLLQALVFTMVLVVVSNNLGIMWIAIEGTTLASAFLVGFYNTENSLEAAWKYIIICSVGITLALLGTILAYASLVVLVPGETASGLDWTTLVQAAQLKQLDPTILKISFILVLVGYGTKVGLAPMHTWLPDAHSQAPTPVSALLSGALLNCAMYGILRFHIITSDQLGPGFSGTLLLLFGVLSLAVSAAFIILAKDYKRLLAYSSIEHMGIISIGFGIGGFFGIFGALLQMLNHAITKSLLFFGSGQVLLKFKTKDMSEVRGLSKVMPATAALLFAGALAITGCPPFGMFLSEFTILYGGLTTGQLLVSGIYLFFLAIIFAAFMYHVGKMVFGLPSQPLPQGEISRICVWAMIFLVAITVVLGVCVPAFLNDALTQIVHLFGGGAP